MAPRGLYVFSHDNKLGRAPAHQLFERIHIEPVQEQGKVPRRFSDYRVEVDGQIEFNVGQTQTQDGVTLTRLV